MRYSIFLPRSKGGYKVGAAKTLEEAIFICHKQSQQHNTVCVIYDKKLKTNDLKRMIHEDMDTKYSVYAM